MKTFALAVLAILCSNLSFSQNDSLLISVFISPVEDLIIEDDSLLVTDEVLLIDGTDRDFLYTFYIAGFDTLTVDQFDLNFTCDDGEVVNSSYTMGQIDSDDAIARIEDSVFLPLGEHEFHVAYTYSVTLKDIDGNIILFQEDEVSE